MLWRKVSKAVKHVITDGFPRHTVGLTQPGKRGTGRCVIVDFGPKNLGQLPLCYPPRRHGFTARFEAFPHQLAHAVAFSIGQFDARCLAAAIPALVKPGRCIQENAGDQPQQQKAEQNTTRVTALGSATSGLNSRSIGRSMWSTNSRRMKARYPSG